MTTVSIKGMSCPHCVASVTKALEDISGISNVTVDLDKAEAKYEGEIPASLVKEAISKIGFEVI